MVTQILWDFLACHACLSANLTRWPPCHKRRFQGTDGLGCGPLDFSWGKADAIEQLHIWCISYIIVLIIKHLHNLYMHIISYYDMFCIYIYIFIGYTCLFKTYLISAFCSINRFCIRTTFLGKPEFLLICWCQTRFSAAKMHDHFGKNGKNSSVFEQRQK